jgi:cytochrome c5
MTPKCSALLGAVAAVLAFLVPAARADESQLTLIDAPGRDAVYANCRTCHSVDYIMINAGIPDRAGWEGSINKMRKVMGAPISDADAAVILDYLAGNYGKPGK